MSIEERRDLEENTRDQADCLRWREESKKRLTASNFGKVARMTARADRAKMAKNIMYGGSFSSILYILLSGHRANCQIILRDDEWCACAAGRPPTFQSRIPSWLHPLVMIKRRAKSSKNSVQPWD